MTLLTTIWKVNWYTAHLKRVSMHGKYYTQNSLLKNETYVLDLDSNSYYQRSII